MLEDVMIHTDHDVPKHVDQSSVSVIRKTLVVGRLGKSFGSLIVQTEVQDGVHHPRH